jgi:hypothetical protein
LPPSFGHDKLGANLAERAALDLHVGPGIVGEQNVKSRHGGRRRLEAGSSDRIVASRGASAEPIPRAAVS